jgi:O-antigen/teichoic acid export membrane protein
MIVGSIWMLAMRWGNRVVGLLSTAILARILMPQDFGLVAMAGIMVGLLDTLSSFGVDLALIQNTAATRRHFDTAWTIQVIQGVGVAAILMVVAPFASWYFHEPRVVPLTRFLALGMVVGGFANIGVVAFRKDLDFGLEFRYSLYKKVISFVITLAMAMVLRNYWALAIGIVLSQIVGCVLSYLMHAYRPRFSLSAVREIWSFSQWMLFVNVGSYSYDKGDELIVGNLTTSRGMGIYAVAYEISNLPTTELVFPISRALFPGFARLVNEPNRLVLAYLNVLGFVSMFAIAAGLGIALVARDLTRIMLGPNWMDAIPLIQLLAIFGVIRAVYGHAGNVLLALGYTRTVAAIMWLQIALLIPGTIVAGLKWGIIAIAAAKIGVALVFAWLLFYYLICTTSLTVTDLFLRIWRPAVSGVVMVMAVTALQRAFPGGAPVVSLFRDAAFGAAVYVSSVTLLWLGSSRPAGTERFLFQLVRDRYAKVRLS